MVQFLKMLFGRHNTDAKTILQFPKYCMDDENKVADVGGDDFFLTCMTTLFSNKGIPLLEGFN